MPFYLVALNNVNNDPKTFSESAIKDPENIRARFKEKYPPEILYEEGYKEKSKVFGRDILETGVVYVWFTRERAEVWRDPEILQNALFCSIAVYEYNPLYFLEDGPHKGFHTVNHIVAFGTYMSDGKPVQKCLLATSKNPETEETMLVAAFKGSDSKEDWIDNLTVTQEQDNSYVGKFHKGFFRRSKSIRIEDILASSKYYNASRIITCGHSLGGAVSSLVHMNLVQECFGRVERRNIINITFGAPFFGNEDLEEYVREKDLCHQMFHFASVDDTFPGLGGISIGHCLKVIEEEAERKLSSLCCPSPVSGLSKVLRHGLLVQNETTLTLCAKFLHLCFSNLEEGSPAMTEFLDSLAHMAATGDSILQNEYEENNYVPVGTVVMLAKNRKPETLDQGPKIKERILQAAFEHQANAKGLRNTLSKIAEGHSVYSYTELVKRSLGGFQKFQPHKVSLNKVPPDENFKSNHFAFIDLSSKSCAFHDCEKSHGVERAGARIKLTQQILAEKFGPFVVNKKEVKSAEDALKRVAVTKFKESLTHDITIGLKIEKVHDFAKHVVNQLQLTTEREVRSMLEMMTLPDSSKSKMDTSKVQQGNFSSMYGFLTSVQSDDNTLTVIYALHKLEFSFPEGRLTGQEIAAVRNHFGKNRALVALQRQNVIKTICYE